MKRETRLESRKIRSHHGSSGRQGNSRGHRASDTGRNESTAGEFGLDCSNLGSLVSPSQAYNRANLVGIMDSLGSNDQVIVDLVHETKVEVGQLGRGRDRCENGSLGIAGSDTEIGETATSGKRVSEVTSHADSLLWNSETGRSVHLGQVHDIEDRRYIEVSLDVIDAKVGTLTGLEGQLDVWSEHQRCFEGMSTICRVRQLIDRTIPKICVRVRMRGTVY